MSNYIIPESERENLTKTLDRYSKKATRYGIPFHYSMSDSFWTAHKINNVTCPVEAFTLIMNEENIIKCGNYSVIAIINHMNGGNVVANLTDRRDSNWIHLPPKCEHCGSNHDRKVTFIVADENGNTKQVGSSCLKDYCGIDPRMAGMSKELQDLVIDEFDLETYYLTHNAAPAWDTAKVFALAVKRVAEAGYVKSTETGSNKGWIIEHMDDELEDEEMEAGKKIIDQLTTMNANAAEASGLNEARTLALQPYFKKLPMVGYIAYAPVALKRTEKHTEQSANTSYVGNVGDKVTIATTDFTLRTSWENAYGAITYLYVFHDDKGNEIIWKASKSVKASGSAIVTGTVKEHKTYNNMLQTVLTRCKVA